jgi:hypothetical protein
VAVHFWWLFIFGGCSFLVAVHLRWTRCKGDFVIEWALFPWVYVLVGSADPHVHPSIHSGNNAFCFSQKYLRAFIVGMISMCFIEYSNEMR